MKTRIIIVAAVRAARDALARELEREALGIEVLSTHPDPRSALEAASMASPDVVIIDSQLGIDAVHALTTRGITANLVVLGASVDQITAWRAAATVHAVDPEADLASLIRAIERAAYGGGRGGTYRLSRKPIPSLDRSAAAVAARDGKRSLTPREMEVVELLEEGLSNKDIARALSISPATVKNHVHSILEKLELRRRGEIAAKLRRDGRRPTRG